MKPLSFLFAFLLAVPALSRADAVVGQAAPAFSLPDLDGKTVTLAQYKGKVVVLEWTNVDCPFVKKHYGSGNIPRLQREAADKGIVWLSVCSSAPGKEGAESAAEIKKTRADWGAASADYLVDAAGTAGRAYGAKTTPHLFVVDKDGTLRYAGAIDSIPTADTADIAKAVPYAENAMLAVAAGKAVQTQATPPYGCSVKY